jgi:sugar phosphate isomerase/epimerase
MRFGIYTSIEQGAAARDAGWDFIEENVQELLQGEVPDPQWSGLQRLRRCPLPVPAANRLLPGTLKVTGPQANIQRLDQYIRRVIGRAEQTGTRILVFGSGAARMVPDGWERQRAQEQIIRFLRISTKIAAAHQVVLVIEALNRSECNIINSLDEAMSYVREIGHPNLQCMVDSCHFWLENDTLEQLAATMPWIKHVHLAERDGHTMPREDGPLDYRPIFRVLKAGGYNADLTVEPAGYADITGSSRVLEFLKRQWNEA